METVAGIFNSPLEARQAALDLRPVGFENSDISLLLPGSSEAALASVPTEEAEQPGMGSALGSVVGGAVGLAGSAPLGAALASVVLPGIGPVIAIGFAAAALGALVGGATGATMEKSMTGGLLVDRSPRCRSDAVQRIGWRFCRCGSALPKGIRGGLGLLGPRQAL